MSDPSITDWISSISTAVGTLAVVFGLFKANSKINETIQSAREARRSHVAEEMIALAHNVQDAFSDIRNPFDSIPKDKQNDKSYVYQRRYERIVKYNDLFKSLRDAQIRVRALIGDETVEKAVGQLFSARARVGAAIQILNDYATDETSDDRAHKKKLRRDMYGASDEDDEVGTMVSVAVADIERCLSNIARMEG